MSILAGDFGYRDRGNNVDFSLSFNATIPTTVNVLVVSTPAFGDAFGCIVGTYTTIPDFAHYNMINAVYFNVALFIRRYDNSNFAPGDYNFTMTGFLRTL
jgi:hypothetical protein